LPVNKPDLAGSSGFADFRAGANAAIIGLPQDLNYGLLAAAPLGAVLAGHGIAVALYASMLALLVTVLAGSGVGRLFCPRPTLSVLMAGLIVAILHIPGVTANEIPFYSMSTVLLSGLMLIAASAMGLGKIVRYVPVPVLSGYTNGVAAMLVLFSLPVALGAGLSSGAFESWMSHIHPAAVFVAGVTVLLALRPLRWSILRKVPGMLQAIASACLTHYLLEFQAGVEAGPLLGELVAELPPPGDLLASLALPGFVPSAWILIAKFSGAIALTAALETLATSASIDGQRGERTSGDRELKRLGVTMACVSPLGMPVAGSLGRSMMLLSAGAASRRAHAYYLLVLAVLVLFGYFFVALLPQAAIAGILIVVARNMVGQSIHQMVREVREANDAVERSRGLADLFVMLLVAIITVADSFITGLAVGVVSAMALFIRDRSRSIIRRITYGNSSQSLKLRSPEARSIQMRHGSEIAVVEVEGILFFGSVDQLGERLEALRDKAREIIIDLRRVSDIDTTATRMLGQLAQRFRAKDCEVLLAELNPQRRLRGALIARGLPTWLPAEYWFTDLDSALEFAESRLLARYGWEEHAFEGLALERSDLAAGLSNDHLSILKNYLVPRRLKTGEVLFRKGDPGNSLYVVARGSLSVHLMQADGQTKRIAAYGPGAVVGEMAMLTGATRSADALMEADSELLELDGSKLKAIEDGHPHLAAELLRAIAIILASRLRDRTTQLRELVES